MSRRWLLVVAIIAAAAATTIRPADAAFPGRPGKLVFDNSSDSCFDGKIYLARPDLSGRRVLANGGNAQFSPNGKLVVYETCDGLNSQLELIHTDGTGHRVLVRAKGSSARSAAEPSFAPSGRSLVFARFAGAGAGQTDLWTVRVDGGGLRELTHTRASEGNPAWAPNGKLIVYSRGGSLYTMRPDGSRVKRLTNGGRPAFSPSSHLIAFTRTDGAALFVIRPNGLGLHRLQAVDIRNRKISGPAFSPAGNLIIYSEEVGRAADLYTVRPNGIGRERIKRTALDEFRVDWQAR